MAAAGTHFKVTLLIPLTDNDGQQFDLLTWTWWSDQLAVLVNGFTEHGVATGWWRGHADHNRVFVIVVKTLREVDALRRLLVEGCNRFRQHAMYFEYHRVFFEEVEQARSL